jgi:predicted small metal-binding protein
MKNFIIKTLLVALPIIIIAAGMETALRNIPNDYKYKKNYLDRNAAKIETLILGSSQEYYGLNPEYFRTNTFNACHVSQGYDMDLAILKKYIDRFDALKTIIIPLSYSSISMNLKNTPEAWRYKNYSIYYGINPLNPEHFSELLSMKSSINIKRILNYYISHQTEITCSSLGWGRGFDAEKSKDIEETASNINRHTIADTDKLKAVADENTETIQKIINLAKEKNIKVILFAPPLSFAYRAERNPAQTETVKTAANKLADTNSNCFYLDTSDFPMFSDADFFDADHLNDIGAKKLSIIVNGWQ